MALITNLIDFVLHVDKHIGILIANYGFLSYFILFLVIFCETGLVITPFLPGDSLIFVAGAFAAKGAFSVFLLFFILAFAAILGDSVNYWIGNYFGEKAFSNSRFFKKEYLDKTKEFYRKHGGKTIIYARFIPIIRTFAPFVAGVGKMDYRRFLGFNVVGGIVWVALFAFGGFFFGGISAVENNMTLVIFLIILASITPPIWHYIKHKTANKQK